MTLGVLFVGGAAQSCGGANVEDNCNAVCMDQKQCAGMPVQDCPSLCAAEAGLSADGDCVDAFTAESDCLLAQQDICNTNGNCDVETSSRLSCISDYCIAKPDDTNCSVLAGK